ncbi:hypothetical protein LCY76_23690 [Fictibacillus sp. KIGAM418]|uniref:Uncharacterized protein n=1 Tax=Fictibacillus marinisediminis TaxID=2878389 RepID=A0A9X1XII8_9BACL|nr:hypothetical protein [Fictibacillus marinisediminis]MCK6259575.1 hypothetical protein [Fictibacillus marinisediminis]
MSVRVKKHPSCIGCKARRLYNGKQWYCILGFKVDPEKNEQDEVVGCLPQWKCPKPTDWYTFYDLVDEQNCRKHDNLHILERRNEEDKKERAI